MSICNWLIVQIKHTKHVALKNREQPLEMGIGEIGASQENNDEKTLKLLLKTQFHDWNFIKPEEPLEEMRPTRLSRHLTCKIFRYSRWN